MKQRRIYLAGPMHGVPEFNIPAFRKAREMITLRGWTVESPVSMGYNFGDFEEIDRSFKALRAYEKECGALKSLPSVKTLAREALLAYRLRSLELETVRSCDAIYMLKGWQMSVGAMRELQEAIKCKLSVFLEGEDDNRL